MKIPYPIKQTEFEIQAKLFSRLNSEGYDAKGEVSHTRNNQVKGYKHCRFDLVVFENKKAKFIIECKNHIKTTFNTRQDRKYAEYGIKVLYCMSNEDIEKIVLACKDEPTS